jgi:hypothetical protein
MPFILMLIQERKREHQQKLQAIYDTYTHSDPFLIEKYSKSIFIVFGRNIFYCKQFLYSLLSIVIGKKLVNTNVGRINILKH